MSVNRQVASPAVVADRAYATYLRVREAVLRMKDSGSGAISGTNAPSDYWAEELQLFDYLQEATPLVIRKLRHHAFHITGIRPYDYRNARDQQAHFEKRLQALVTLAGGRELLVAEHPALGGFGFRIEGALYNVDTLKFFEVLVGMQRASVLQPFAREAGRRTVLEVGGGWGGFAYQFKTLFPNTTYVIVDFPELFLYSATYLGTVCPDARLAFYGDATTSADWQGADFLFVPNTAMAALEGLRPDLLVNLVSFQEMTAAQVGEYARCAAAMSCPVLYSLNRERSYYNREIDSVSGVLRQHYVMTDLPLLATDYTHATKKDSVLAPAEVAARQKKARDAGEQVLPYRHMVGTLRRDAKAHDASVVPAESTTSPGVAIGATLYNRAAYLPEALDSLLAQTHRDFRLVLVDDASTDETEAIARVYAARDARITYVRNTERLGMVGTWRRAFEIAAADPAVRYFAWASDHDRWHPEWLERLAGMLDGHEDVVLAYAQTQRIDPAGAPLAKPARLFDTLGVADVRRRWADMSTTRSLAAGDMVYGLMRADALRASGVFRDVLSPDRLLMAELTIHGQIHQVPDVLWYRRQFETGSVVRQKHTLFRPGDPPRGAALPPWLQHARVLWREYAASDATPLGGSRSEARRLIVRYAAAYATRHHQKTTVHRRFAGFLGWCRHLYKRAKHLALLAVFYTLVYGRRAFWGSVYYVLVALRRLGVTPAIERLYERFTYR